MDTDRSRQLHKIISLSSEMLEQARKLEWPRVAELEVERKALVMECFRQPASEQDAPAVAESIKQILELNQAIEALGRECRDQLGGKIHMRNVGRTAAAAYLSASR